MRLLSILALLFLGHSIQAQNFLLLKNGSGKIAVVYELQDQIRLQLKGEDDFIEGKITHFEIDHFEIDGRKILVDNVYRFDVREKAYFNFNFDASANVLMIAAVVLPAAHIFNEGIETFADQPTIPESIQKVGTTFILAGLLIKILRPKYFKPRRKKSATIISNIQIAYQTDGIFIPQNLTL